MCGMEMSIANNMPELHRIVCSETTNVNDLIKYLQERPGEDVSIPTGEYPAYFAGLTPLHLAALVNRAAMAQVLIEHGGDVTVVCRCMMNAGENPLHTAVNKGHMDVVRVLIDGSSDVDAIYTGFFGDGREASLHLAARSGFASIVEVLVGAGANVNAKDENGKTPLQVAEGEAKTVLESAQKPEYRLLLILKYKLNFLKRSLTALQTKLTALATKLGLLKDGLEQLQVKVESGAE